jgi:hypothetical protein
VLFMRVENVSQKIFINFCNGERTWAIFGQFFSVADKLANDFHFLGDTRKFFKIGY